VFGCPQTHPAPVEKSVVEPPPTVVDNRRLRKYVRKESQPSVVAGKEGSVADAGLMFGRSFRPSWGPNGELVHLCGVGGPVQRFV
jgi:hypothetical protein